MQQALSIILTTFSEHFHKILTIDLINKHKKRTAKFVSKTKIITFKK